MKEPLRILIVRNDKLGDFMLVWPALALLKKQYPDSMIYALVAKYTEPMAELCPWIDEVVVDIEEGSGIIKSMKLASILRRKSIDVSISFFSTTHTAFALWWSFIPARFAPATKLAQLFYNRRLKQRRSRSEKPEYIYNTDLVKYFIRKNGDQPVEAVKPPYLLFDEDLKASLKQQFIREHCHDKDARLVFVHPGSGGSAPALNVQQYALLIDKLSVNAHWCFVITAGPGELALAQQLSGATSAENTVVYESQHGLKAFAEFLSIADIFISGSTGVLHIAGALDVPTVAFYTRRLSATSLRWQTMNSSDRRLYFCPPESAEAEDMQSIDVEDIASKILGSSLGKI